MGKLLLPDRSWDCDQIVRKELASSLSYVSEAGASVLKGASVDIGAVSREIERHRVEPTLFARYYELVLALKAGRPDRAVALYRELADQSSRFPEFATKPLDPTSGEADRYVRWLNPQRNGVPPIDAPNMRRWQAFAADVDEALDLVGRADPALGAELHALLVEVVGVSSHRDASEPFESASTFMLWGAVFLNVDAHPTRLHVAAGLVHEGAHQLLFGLSCREPLVRNALSERYPSPLRSDLRPVIGIYHATFVCARMCHAYEAMLLPGLGVTGEERLSLERRLRARRACFAGGLETLRREGALTDLGQRILDQAAVAVELA